MSSQAVKLSLRLRRFRCSNSTCARRTLTECFKKLTTAWARRTNRLTPTLKKIALALGGEAGKRVTDHLAMAPSGDMVIRILLTEKPVVVVSPQLAVDDWAIRRGQSYGTLLVDLEQRRYSINNSL